MSSFRSWLSLKRWFILSGTLSLALVALMISSAQASELFQAPPITSAFSGMIQIKTESAIWIPERELEIAADTIIRSASGLPMTFEALDVPFKAKVTYFQDRKTGAFICLEIHLQP